jgi:putative N-acetyltransferase (TIGR04045 family)
MRRVRCVQHPEDGGCLMLLDVPILDGGTAQVRAPSAFLIQRVDSRAEIASYHRLRHDAFVDEQGLFEGHDLDAIDDDPRTIVLAAIDAAGEVVGGVRLSPATDGRDLGWWTGGRLVVAKGARSQGHIGAALVRAACALAEQSGVLRFDATVQLQNQPMFDRLGWVAFGTTQVAGVEHVRMRWPIDRIERLATSSKSFLASLLQPFDAWSEASAESLGGAGFVGDDGAPIAGTDVIAACDAILPSLVERDPEWAGWCAVLVNINDLSAMGAGVVGLFDALGARDASFASRVFSGLRNAASAWGAPILGGHTQLGVPASLSVTALGRTSNPIPGGGGRLGQAVSVSVDLTGDWHPRYTGAQWDSTSERRSEDLREMAGMVARAAPSAAKDISMAGLVGTLGMLAEASGRGAVLDVERVPAPGTASAGDWLTCFPGFGMITTDAPGESRMSSPLVATRECGTLTAERGVQLRWPDGLTTSAIAGPVTGLGRA